MGHTAPPAACPVSRVAPGDRAIFNSSRGETPSPIYRTRDMLYLLYANKRLIKIERKGAATMLEEVLEMWEQLSEENKRKILTLEAALLSTQPLQNESAADAQE